MDGQGTQALSEVLDRLEDAVEGESVTVGRIVDGLGHHSFAALMLVFALISTSPASAIPGVTAVVAVIVLLLVLQMIAGRNWVWLPGFVTKRELAADKLCKGTGWLRKPVRFVERFLRPRLGFLYRRPWLYLPLLLILGLTLVMPFMEAIPTSGSIASAVIALFAAGLLTRDGVLGLVSLTLLAAIAFGAFAIGFSGS